MRKHSLIDRVLPGLVEGEMQACDLVEGLVAFAQFGDKKIAIDVGKRITRLGVGLGLLAAVKAQAQLGEGQHGPPPPAGLYYCDNNATITLQPLQTSQIIGANGTTTIFICGYEFDPVLPARATFAYGPDCSKAQYILAHR